MHILILNSNSRSRGSLKWHIFHTYMSCASRELLFNSIRCAFNSMVEIRWSCDKNSYNFIISIHVLRWRDLLLLSITNCVLWWLKSISMRSHGRKDFFCFVLIIHADRKKTVFNKGICCNLLVFICATNVSFTCSKHFFTISMLLRVRLEILMRLRIRILI